MGEGRSRQVLLGIPSQRVEIWVLCLFVCCSPNRVIFFAWGKQQLQKSWQVWRFVVAFDSLFYRETKIILDWKLIDRLWVLENGQNGWLENMKLLIIDSFYTFIVLICASIALRVCSICELKTLIFAPVKFTL